MDSTSFLYRADGSASWRLASSYVITSVSGPMEAPRRDEVPTESTLELIVRPDIGVTTTREHFMQDRIRSAIVPVIVMDMHPRTLIQVVVQIVSSDMNTLAASINATCMALIDAGIPMRATVSACSIVYADQIYVNPEKQLLDRLDVKSVHTVAYEVAGGSAQRVLMTDSVGKFTPEMLFECLQVAKDVCVEANQDMRSRITSRVSG